ncbi:MAG: OmpH family outer membrane protein [Saprospiraceae bacterium]
MRHLIALFSFLALLSACQQPGATADAVVSAVTPGVKIGYVNTDTVLTNYGYLNTQTDILTTREADASASLERKVRNFQDKVQSFQRRAQGGNMTPKSIENEQRALAQKEQELSQEQQRLAQEFQSEGMRLQSEVMNVLKEKVDAAQAAGGYDYILSYGGGSNVLAVNPTYDITKEVLDLMNASTTTTTEAAPAGE